MLSPQESASALSDTSELKDALNAIDVDVPIKYTEEDLDTMRQVATILKEEHKLTDEHIGKRFLAYTCIVNKNRVDESVKKYLTFFKAIGLCHVDGVYEDSLWTDQVGEFLADFYAPCGKDHNGRSIMWINGSKPVTTEMEETSVKAGIAYVLAIHADEKSLREGITFVIDTSKRASFEKQGNEAKLQKINQAYPLRPQSIMIAGASMTMRIVINGLIRVASIFAKSKVLQRIKFVSLDQAIEAVPKASAPKYLGGGGGGIDNVAEWTKKRLDSFPVPEL